jgi:hypothetical protein
MRATPHFEDLREMQGLEPHGSGGRGDVTADSVVLLLAHYRFVVVCLFGAAWNRFDALGALGRTWGCASPHRA